MIALDVMLERETANDEEATVVAIFFKSGSRVEKDDVLFDIENSKATQEVVALQAGLLTHSLDVGQTVLFGVPIAHITPDARPGDAAHDPAPSVPDPAPLTVAQSPAPPPTAQPALPRAVSEPRLSRAAAALIRDLGLTEAQFSTDFVTTRDIRARAGLLPAPPPERRMVASPGAPGKPVTARKRAEIDALVKGAGDTMLSVLGTTLGAMTIARSADDFLDGQITDLVLYEASRLLKKYPRLNAFYNDGQVIEHAAVHAGLAIDRGGQLVVYGIEHADRMSLQDIGGAMAEAVERYMNDALTAGEMSRATFTVTDLSADDLDFVLPLLPRGQSCILGITRAQDVGYRIFAGFDHRVTEGREVASFLGELRQRLLSFASANPRAVVTAQCEFCARSSSEATANGRDKGLLKIVDRAGRDILCCASCWNGW